MESLLKILGSNFSLNPYISCNNHQDRSDGKINISFQSTDPSKNMTVNLIMPFDFVKASISLVNESTSVLCEIILVTEISSARNNSVLI